MGSDSGRPQHHEACISKLHHVFRLSLHPCSPLEVDIESGCCGFLVRIQQVYNSKQCSRTYSSIRLRNIYEMEEGLNDLLPNTPTVDGWEQTTGEVHVE